ncbi:O-antigen ligase family protein [Mycobacterium sp. SMC-8]|uniref:O-antigen ligase family protein n=1 Tax=Mycobacterium sp. SMC-8 TaxID=2857060 RepID=UPI0021B489C8|nr:O-antigen ligase family protein [Mycobacterium sp. SMC-8]UXA14944.1 O-antigen ligase family protein [Mycobacterium sp. SMC-8]
MPVELATVAVLWTLSTCIFGLAARGRPTAASPLVGIMTLFLFLITVSLLWATPSGVDNGVATTVRGALFLLWLREVIVVAKEDPGFLNTVVLWTVPGVAVQSVLSIIFRIDPGVEFLFLNSKLATYLVGPQASDLYADITNNVWYPFKSGGFFVNGNVASLFGGVAALLFIVAARRSGRHWPYAVAILALTGSIYTGSKTAILVTVGCALVILLLPHMLRGWAVLAAIPIAILAPLTASLAIELLQKAAPNFFALSERSLDDRGTMWSGAATLFKESPLAGLGFGGWSEQMTRFTSRPDMPPHNLIIATWANSGTIAAIVAVVFIAAAIAFGLRVAAAQPTVHERRTAILALCAVTWVFLHGMADNTTVYGEQRSMILFALAIGYLYAMTPNMHRRQHSADIEGNSLSADQRPQSASRG